MVGSTENRPVYTRAFDKAFTDCINDRDAALEHMECFRQPKEEEVIDPTTIVVDGKRQLGHIYQDLEMGMVDAEANMEKPPTKAL